MGGRTPPTSRAASQGSERNNCFKVLRTLPDRGNLTQASMGVPGARSRFMRLTSLVSSRCFVQEKDTGLARLRGGCNALHSISSLRRFAEECGRRGSGTLGPADGE